MRIIALDTSTETCSVALFNRGKINCLFEYCYRNHSQRILPLIQQILIEGKISLNKLDAVAYSRGPGNFTGLRIGMGVAKGIGIGANLAIIGVSSLAIMAESSWRIRGTDRVLVAIQAKKKLFYWAEYRRNNITCWHGKETETVLSTMDIQNRISQLTGSWGIAGTGWYQYINFNRKKLTLIKSINTPIARDIFTLAMLVKINR
ncbi:MAG: tRNA (adenosine(37)-N6)-threonylcarbamoyltransferase complex dimerization subunit type 1 TsaB [Candidatus Dasytiphilus stammeri]